MIKKGALMEGERYKALVIDCGGGTTDLCSCVFKVWDKRAAYRIEIETAYENGDTDFGGNNLTYRIMQLLKAAVADRISGGSGQAETDDIMEREVKFFVWAVPSDWAFLVVPVYRRDGRLFLGKEEEFLFENDNWVQNFFDGMK